MSQNKQSLEEIFQNAFRHEAIKPSARVLRRLRFKLFISDFMHFSVAKINIYYATALLTGSIITVLALNNSVDNTTINNSAAEKNQTVFASSTKNVFNSVAEPFQNNSQTLIEENTVKKGAKLMALFRPSITKGCAPLEVSFKNESALTTSVLWDFGTGETSTQINPNYNYKTAGNYKATLTLKDSEGNTASYSKDIIVYDAPHADFTIDLEQSDIRMRQIVFVNKSNGGSKYTWDFGDKTSSSEQKPIHIYTNYEKYNVSLIVSTEQGCSDTSLLANTFIENNYELAFPLNLRPNLNYRNNEGFYERSGSEGGIFYPENYGATQYELNIIAPNGITVFNTNNIKQGWNGFIGGRLAPSGIYYYETSGIYPNGKKFSLNGSVKVLVDEQYLE